MEGANRWMRLSPSREVFPQGLLFGREAYRWGRVLLTALEL